VTRICFLSHYNSRYTVETDYELSRLLDEASKRGLVGEVLRLPSTGFGEMSAMTSVSVSSVDSKGATIIQEITIPRYLQLNESLDTLPDIVLLKNSFSASWREQYSALFDNYKSANVTIVNEIEQQTRMTNKADVYRILQAAGIPIPKTLILPYPLSDSDKERVEDEIGYPCAIKLPHGYEGSQVELCRASVDLTDVVDQLVERRIEPVEELIFQEHIHDSFHTYSAHIVGDFINADIRIGDPTNPEPFKASSMPGNMRFQFAVDSQLEAITKASLAAIGLDFARFDLVKKNGQYLILEANVSGTFTRTENCNRANIAGALIDRAVAVHQNLS
jgi:glutathione synthase/RimK-type ligase-like ATP-grasp enzyme